MTQELIVRVIFETGRATPKAREMTRTVKYLEGSFADLNLKILQATKELNEAVVGTTAFTNASNKLRAAENALLIAQEKARIGTKSFNKVSGATRMTMMSLNYTLRDSPYFFKNVQMGIMAVGNNLNPLIDGIIRMRMEAKTLGKTFRSQLMGALKGPAGMIFLFSVLVSVFQAVSFAMEGTSKKSGKLKGDLERLKGIVKELVKIENPFEKLAARVKGEDIEGAIEKLRAKMFALGDDTKTTTKALTEEQIELKQELDAAIISLKNASDENEFLTAQEKVRTKEAALLIETIDNQNESFAKQKERILTVIKFLEQELALGKERTKVAELLASVGLTLTEKDKKKKEKSLILTDAQLKAQIKLHENALKLTNSERERYLLNKKLEELYKDLARTSDQLPVRTEEQIKNELERYEALFKSETSLFNQKQLLEQIQKLEKELAQHDIPKPPKITDEDFPDIILPDEQLGYTADQVELLNGLISLTGTTFTNAFLEGKLAIGDFLKEIGKLILQLLIVKGLTSWIFGTPFTLFGAPEEPIEIPDVPGMGSSKISTPQPLQPTFVFENTIDTQEIVLKGVRNLQGELR